MIVFLMSPGVYTAPVTILSAGEMTNSKSSIRFSKEKL